MHGLAADDVDAIGIPPSKLGLRKKLIAKYLFPKDDEVRPARDPPEGSSMHATSLEQSLGRPAVWFHPADARVCRLAGRCALQEEDEQEDEESEDEASEENSDADEDEDEN